VLKGWRKLWRRRGGWLVDGMHGLWFSVFLFSLALDMRLRDMFCCSLLLKSYGFLFFNLHLAVHASYVRMI
jgi:hypothetical protein